MRVSTAILYVLPAILILSYSDAEAVRLKRKHKDRTPSSSYGHCPDEGHWYQEPDVVDGFFESGREIKCTMKRTQTFKQLSEALIHHLKTTREIHGQQSSVEGLTQTWELDTTNRIEDGGTEISIREDVMIERKGEKEFIYSTQSTKVEAEGSAGYLKGVSFSAYIIPSKNDNGSVEILMKNSIKVEKPWYAFLVFGPIATSIAKEKFAESVHIVLAMIEKHLYIPQRVAERKELELEEQP